MKQFKAKQTIKIRKFIPLLTRGSYYFAFFLVGAVIFSFPTTTAYALDQWEIVTPPGTTGYVFNTISVMGDYLYLGTDHGIYKSIDGGANWNQVNAGLSDLNIKAISLGWIYDTDHYSIEESSPVFIATPGGVFRSTLGENSWTQVNHGLSDTNVLDIEIDQAKALLLADPSTIYTGTGGQESGAYRSDDLADNWLKVSDGLPEGVKITKLVSDFGNGLLYALVDNNKLYTANLFSFSGADESWTEIYNGQSVIINDIAILNALGYINYLATSEGVLKSDTSGQNWQAVNNGLTSTQIKNVASDYADSNLSYAASAGDGVFRTTDEAGFWVKINKGLSDLNIKEVKTNPTGSTTIYAVGQSGIYKLELSDPYVDITPPATVSDLSVFETGENYAILNWTAPGDDGNVGQVFSYDIRYSTSPITDANWNLATEVEGEPSYHEAGTAEVFIVQNLTPSTTYYFALKAFDENNNYSDLSNVVSNTFTPLDTIAPAAISNLTAGNFTVDSITLTWTAPGDDGINGTASSYDLRYSTANITGANWSQVIQVNNEPAPQVVGTNQSFTVIGLTASTTYYFAIKTSDEIPNTSALSNIASAATSALPDTTAPSIPINLTAGVISISQTNLFWATSTDPEITGALTSGLAGYKVYRSGSQVATTTILTFEDTGLSAGTSYNYNVSAYDLAGNESAKSATTTATTSTASSDSGSSGGGGGGGGGNTSSLTSQPSNQTSTTTVNIINNTGQINTDNEPQVLGSIAYYSLAKEPSQIVEAVSYDEANSTYNHNQFVIFSKGNAALYDKITGKTKANLNDRARYAIAYFIEFGTSTTYRLGTGERAGVVGSFYATFGRLPESDKDWQDIIKIANGRWPGRINKAAEDKAKIIFKKIYKRNPDPKIAVDNNALVIIAYGLRPVQRNLNSEANALKTFKYLYGRLPQTSGEWDIARAIAYSGAKR